MTAWEVTCIILVVLSQSQFSLGFEVAQDNNCKKVLGQVPLSAATQKGELRSNSKANLGFEVCAKVCSWWSCTTYYCTGDGLCCTPGNPESKCCPAEYPLCLGDGCCPEGYPKICGKYCCEEESFCCNGENCCKNEDACCGKEQCCLEEAPCCKQDDTSTCCNKDTMGCCDGYGCVPPCPSQFDAIGCQLSSLSPDAKHWERKPPTAPKRKLYRVLRKDEQPKKGLVAKNPKAKRTVLSHVNCGSRRKYTSQYISTTASLDVAKHWKKKGEEQGVTGLRIAEIDEDKLPESTQVVDLTTEENRDEYLGKAVCKNFAKASEEVLLQCDEPIPCKVIDPPPENDANIKDSREL